MTPRPGLFASSYIATRYRLSPDDEPCVPQSQWTYMAHARVQGYAWRVYWPVRAACPDFDRDTGDHIVFCILHLTAEPAS